MRINLTLEDYDNGDNTLLTINHLLYDYFIHKDGRLLSMVFVAHNSNKIHELDSDSELNKNSTLESIKMLVELDR